MVSAVKLARLSQSRLPARPLLFNSPQKPSDPEIAEPEDQVSADFRQLLEAGKELHDLHTAKSEYSEEDLTRLKREQLFLCARLALDIAGFFDPTPICDGASAILSLTQLDFVDAALSVVSMVPVFGDVVAKPLKGGKFAVKMTRAIRKGRKMRQAMKQAKPPRGVTTPPS